MKDFQNALKFSTKVINMNDEQLSPGAYAVKSEALVETGHLDEALTLLYEGLSKFGDDYLLHFNMAVNYFKKDDMDKTLEHVKKAIDLDKSQSGAFLLYSYALNNKGFWVQSILSMQMFLLLEPDSNRSKNAYEEMLQTMRIKKTGQPVERSFIQQQMMRNSVVTLLHPEEIPPLSVQGGLNRNLVYHAITATLDSLQSTPVEEDEFMQFKVVNRAIMKVLQKESLKDDRQGIFWTFYVPFFSHIEQSGFYDTFCRYISVSYYPESLKWWQQNRTAAENFVLWFEKGDNL
jgi:tetratricopeptide (TPR) repeat protein